MTGQASVSRSSHNFSRSNVRSEHFLRRPREGGDHNPWRLCCDEATRAKPGYPECVAMIVQIGDHLSKQYDLKD
jgi:hypothetical protein